MKHFILTRFNETYFAINNLNPNISINDEWLANRIKIFKSITVPSVYAQTDKEFTWIVKCNPKTPTWVRKELEGEYLVCYDEFDFNIKEDPSPAAPIYPKIWQKIIRQMTTDKEIITTALDSDDAIANDHINLVKNFIKPLMFFDFNRGLIKNKEGLFLHYKPMTSQFYSFMDYNTLHTVYHKTHHVNENIIKNQIEWGWLQNNHSNNVLNGSLICKTGIIKGKKTYPLKATETDIKILINKFPFISNFI